MALSCRKPRARGLAARLGQGSPSHSLSVANTTMPPSLADHVGRYWLESTRTAPTRGLQLSFERAEETYHSLDDFAIVLAILKNNPSVVAPDLVAQVEAISKLIGQHKARVVSTRNEKRRIQYSQTIDPFRTVLPKYLLEKSQGLHAYASIHDCSLDLISSWIEVRMNDPTTKRYARAEDSEVVALGHADYLRLAARAIQDISRRIWHSGITRGASTLHAALKGQRELNQKSLGKLLKRLSSATHLADAPVPEHQDVVLMLAGDRIRFRPASFTQETKWEIARAGDTAYGSIHNLLTDLSPVHVGIDPLEEFEELLNTPSAGEADFQHFFERYPKFLLGTDYSRAISQPILVREDEHDLVPDFIMIPHSFARPAILDLKLPTASLARHRANREGFLQTVMEARDQLLEYRNYFSSKTTAIEARNRFGCDLYLPRMAVVIGRSSSFTDEYERRKIESRVPDIDVITYDDIYNRALQCRQIGLL